MMPQGDLKRSARGHHLSKLQRTAGFRDPWALATAEREDSFSVTQRGLSVISEGETSKKFVASFGCEAMPGLMSC